MTRIYLYGSEITDGIDVWREFRNYDRDYYPQEVYDYIYDCLNDQSTDDVVELDVIAWCCDIEQETFDADKVLQETHDEYWENALADFESGEMPHRPLPYAVWVRVKATIPMRGMTGVMILNNATRLSVLMAILPTIYS
jgi:hypothetical protein